MLLSPPESHAMNAAGLRGLWSSLAKMPMQMPKQAVRGNPGTSHMQQHPADAVRACLQPARSDQQLAATKQDQTYLPSRAGTFAPETASSALPFGGHYPVQQSRRQQPTTGWTPFEEHNSEQPADICPQVQFGVFTNLKSGSSFARPGTMSTAAQRRMRAFAADLGQQQDIVHPDLNPNHQQPPVLHDHGKENEFFGMSPAKLSPLQQQAVPASNSDEAHPPANAEAADMETQPSFAAEQPGAPIVHVHLLTQPSGHDSLSGPAPKSLQQEPASIGERVLMHSADELITDADLDEQVIDALTPDHIKTQHVAQQPQAGMSASACSAIQLYHPQHSSP